MSETPEPDKVVVTSQTADKPNWGLRIGLGAIGLVLAAAAYFILSTVLPVSWATTIKNQANGDLGTGLLLGLFYGFVFTFIPLLVLWQARHKRVTWPWKAALLGAAILLAIPNILTLGIYTSNSASALRARNMIDNDATWFPGWSLGAAIGAAVIFVAFAILWEIWRARGKKLKEVKEARKLVTEADRKNSRKQQPAVPAPTEQASETGADAGPGDSLAWLPEENDGTSAR